MKWVEACGDLFGRTTYDFLVKDTFLTFIAPKIVPTFYGVKPLKNGLCCIRAWFGSKTKVSSSPNVSKMT